MVLTQTENEEMTQVGPGTPGGEFLRRYWHPISVAADLTPERPKKRVRIMGEDLVLFRTPVETALTPPSPAAAREGVVAAPWTVAGEASDVTYGLVKEQCSHRGCSLYYGFLEDGNIRCAYHGWMYDKQGKIVETPFEPEQSLLKHTLRHPAYPVIKVRGLLFAYMGPAPAPILPPWDVLARRDGTHEIGVHAVLNANWLQMFETNVDPTHNTFLHSKWGFLVGMRKEFKFVPIELEFERFEFGIVKRREFGGDEAYKEEGHPILLPNVLRHSSGHGPIDLQWRTPIDDTHTQTFTLDFRPSKDGSIADSSDDPPWKFDALKDEEGYFTMKSFPSQDSMAWETQGPIRDRSLEHLGMSDKGVAMLRELLKEQIDKVKRGEEPMGVLRDPEEYDIISFSASK
ncbi:MAG TPA: aromatic ring-hydroxylating dioxygenase subunit alpha [Chloroflexota bacterium]